MTGLFTISYRSIAKLRAPERELEAILAESRDRNARCGLTGLLMYDGVYFMQTIEGPFEDVGAVFLKILGDPRHMDVVPFGISEIETRAFPDWQMRLLGREMTNRIVPDMADFDFDDRRLGLIHDSARAAIQNHLPL